MKNILLIIVTCLLVVSSAYSQSDTLFTRKQKKIACKIVEIGENDLKYTLADLPNGPVYVISKANILKYTLSNGYTELVVPDEMSIENEHSAIIKNRQAIKLQPFSFANNQVSLAYEKVIKVGMNLDVEVGYINNSINQNPLINSNNYMFNYGNYPYYGNYIPARIFYTGAYVKPGVKFFLGQDYSIKGMKYAHPLKGRYIKLDLAFSYLNFQNVKRTETTYTPSGSVNKTLSTNISSFAFGGFVNYGRQFILGNVLTFEYYIGIGYTGQSNSYSNSDFLVTNQQYYGKIEDGAKSISNYHGFQRAVGSGLSGTAGFRIGYILPDKKAKQAQAVK
jgi:hypothetical protein